MASRRNVQYSQLPNDDDDLKRYDPRFDYVPRSFNRIPWKSIALALFLLCLGCLLLFLSFFIFTGHMSGEKSQAYGLLLLGILTFLPAVPNTKCLSHRLVFRCKIFLKQLSRRVADYAAPTQLDYFFTLGFYETRIAYYSWRGVEGYQFSSIPDY